MGASAVKEAGGHDSAGVSIALVAPDARMCEATPDAIAERPASRARSLRRGREPRLLLGRSVLAPGWGHDVVVFDLVCRKSDNG